MKKNCKLNYFEKIRMPASLRICAFKNHRLALHIFFIIMLFTFSGCGKKIATVTIVDEKTALEKQILGQFAGLNKEVYLIASVRGIDKDGSLNKADSVPESKRRVLAALQRIAYNEDDIKDLKKIRVLGENNEGFIKIFEETISLLDEKKQRLARELVMQENEDRKIVISRIIETNINLADKEPKAVGKIYASMKRDSAEKGELIQLPDNTWTEKK